MGAILQVSKLSKKYDRHKESGAVNDVSFTVGDGNFLAIVGRSGSGKSTLLAMIGGICRPSAGSVVVGEESVWTAPKRAELRNNAIGYVFQFASLLPSLRAIDNVALPALINGALDQRVAYARAKALMAQVGLESKYDAYPGELSGGEQRRVAIARALINSPPLLLADEPTADLDFETEKEILDLLVEMRRLHQFTLVVVTHNRDIAARADQILTMQNGFAELAEAAPVALAHDGSESQSAQSTSSAVKNIFAITAENAAREKIALGSGLDRFVGRIVIVLIPLISLIYIGNLALAAYQQSIINARLDAQQALEELAMSDLKAGVKNITMQNDGVYELKIFLRNVKDGKPMYVMTPAIRLFVQVGTSWQEVPLEALDAKRPPVTAIKGEQLLTFRLRPAVGGYTQLIPYYMHVRITNNMLVSPSSQPREDLIERDDSYYVYLKPHDIDDAKINARMQFAEKPPVFIPMPPH